MLNFLKFFEFDYEKNEYTDWSREIGDKLPKEWLKSKFKFRNCFYEKSNSNNIVVYDEQYFVVINKEEKMPKFEEKIFSKISKRKACYY